jgi:hypothetical protein
MACQATLAAHKLLWDSKSDTLALTINSVAAPPSSGATGGMAGQCPMLDNDEIGYATVSSRNE